MKIKIKHFIGLTEFNEIKTKYKELVKTYHPDLNPLNGEIMKEINSEYDFIIANLASLKSENVNTDIESKFKDLILELLKLELELEICGSWIWISGNTKEHKEKLKELKCFWAPKKKKWYYRPSDKRVYSRGKFSMQEIRAKYGSSLIKANARKRLTA